MNTLPRRNALVAGAALVLVACSDTESAEVSAETKEPLCFPEIAARIAAWEEEDRAVAAWLEQNRGALPTDYDELARFPSAYRRAALLAFAPEHVSALVQEHLRRSIAARPEMTVLQREVISQAQQLFTPAWYSGPPEMHVAAWQGDFGQRIGDAFSVPERMRIFGSIGPEDEGIRARIADALPSL